jgi:hypothetical protein
MIDKPILLKGLKELADVDIQKRLWLNDGSSKETGSFTEAIRSVFCESNLSEAIENGYLSDYYSEKLSGFVKKLEKIHKDLETQDFSHEELIALPEMDIFRGIAAKLIDLFTKGFTRQEKLRNKVFEIEERLVTSLKDSETRANEVVADSIGLLNNYLETYTEYYGDRSEICFGLGLCYFYSQDKTEKNLENGKQWFLKALDINENRRYRKYLGWLYFKHGKYEEVIKNFKIVAPDYSESLYELNSITAKIDELIFCSNVYLYPLSLDLQVLERIVSDYVALQEMAPEAQYIKVFPHELISCMEYYLPELPQEKAAEVTKLLKTL